MKGEDLEGDEKNKKYSLRKGFPLLQKNSTKQNKNNKKTHQQIQLDIIRQANRQKTAKKKQCKIEAQTL